MAALLRDFLQCVRLTGHARLANAIEARVEATEFASAAPDRPFPLSLELSSNHPVHSLATDAHPEELARQLCLVDHALYCAVETRELLHTIWTKKPELAPNIRALAAQFNRVATITASSVLAGQRAEERAAAAHFWLGVAQHLMTLRNYASLLAVASGLNSTPVARLKLTWAAVPREDREFLARTVALMDRNFAGLRALYVGAAPPVVPYLGAYQRDLVYLDESPTWKSGDAATGLVNLHKLRAISAVVHNCLAFQSGHYWFREVRSIARAMDEALLLTEDQQHARSLEVEPRSGAPPAPPQGAVGGTTALLDAGLTANPPSQLQPHVPAEGKRTSKRLSMQAKREDTSATVAADPASPGQSKRTSWRASVQERSSKRGEEK